MDLSKATKQGVMTEFVAIPLGETRCLRRSGEVGDKPMEPRETRQVNRFKLMPEACTDGPMKGYIGLDRIGFAARKNSSERFMNLMHHLNEFNLTQAFRQLDGSKAVGIDQVTKYEYGSQLQSNIEVLHSEIRGGGWRPRPSREKLIPKPQGGMRRLAIGCLEDKIVQSLCAKILEAIYEPIFHRHSFGYRSGKSPHQAIARVHQEIRRREETCVVVEMGTPQGNPISPVLANIYLHYVLDDWFEENWAKKGQHIRYADDAIFVFNQESDAQEFQDALRKRLGEHGIRLNADKSGLTRFNKRKPEGDIPFLGFILYWGRQKYTRKRILKVKTAPKKLAASIQRFKEWIKANRSRHRLAKLWELASAKFRGHYAYYGVTLNAPKLNHYYYACIGELFKWLNRRSQKKSYTWDGFERRLYFNPIPKPPHGSELIDITNGIGTKPKHKPKSRVRENRKHGSVRNDRQQCLSFT
jgi:RNA-directed DNA polymerase